MAYQNPGFTNNAEPYLNAQNLNAIADTLECVPVANGGTGATTAADARTNLGITINNVLNNQPLPVANGGTGTTSLSGIKSALGIGTRVSETRETSVSIGSSIYYDVLNASLSAGVWLVIGRVRWPSNTTGTRRLNIVQGTLSGWRSSAPAVNYQYDQQVVTIVNKTSAGDIHLVAWQNSGGGLTIENATLEAVRIA